MALALTELDDRIQSKPFTQPISPEAIDCNHNMDGYKLEHSVAFPTSYQHCGYLDINNTTNACVWNRKYFMISNNYLLSAPTSMSLKLDEIIYLQDSTVTTKDDIPHTIFNLITSLQQLHFRCTSSLQSTQWINAIRKASKLKIKDIYIFEYILGTSGTTKVVAAKHKITNEKSAIKIVDKRICNKKMLRTEIEILKKLDNEFIVHLYDCIETKTYLYIVMEQCTGGELFDKIIELDGDHFKETDCCLIMHQIAKGVKYMHSMGIIHRDLKPENILCVEPNSFRNIKIADFGISKIFTNETKSDEDENDTAFISMDTMICSISYTAPEILLKQKYDYRADYYSIGVILYILLCGYPPFSDDENDENVIKSILNDELIFEDEDWEHVSNETKDLVKGLLEKDPNKRKTCDNILKLVWKVTNSTMSFEKAMENFKKHVIKRKMKNYSFSAYDLSSGCGSIFDNKEITRRLKSTSCSLLPGFSSGMSSSQYSQSTDSSYGDLSVSSDFVYVNAYVENSELKV